MVDISVIIVCHRSDYWRIQRTILMVVTLLTE